MNAVRHIGFLKETHSDHSTPWGPIIYVPTKFTEDFYQGQRYAPKTTRKGPSDGGILLPVAVLTCYSLGIFLCICTKFQEIFKRTAELSRHTFKPTLPRHNDTVPSCRRRLTVVDVFVRRRCRQVSVTRALSGIALFLSAFIIIMVLFVLQHECWIAQYLPRRTVHII